jgi:hypothetical protein
VAALCGVPAIVMASPGAGKPRLPGASRTPDNSG